MNGVTVAMLVAAATITVDEVIGEGGLPPLRSYIGIVFAGVMLGALSEPAPELASALAALFALGVVFSRGPRVLNALGGR